MLSRSASSGKPDSNSPDCIVACYFCGVSLYLRCWDIRCCRCFFWCCGICTIEIFAIADVFFGAVVSARLRYSLSQMLFWCQSCIIASAIHLFHDLKMLPLKKTASSTCLSQDLQILPTLLPLHNLNFVIWYHYIFREFLFSGFSKPHGSHLGFQFLKHNPIWKEMLLTSW